MAIRTINSSRADIPVDTIHAQLAAISRWYLDNTVPTLIHSVVEAVCPTAVGRAGHIPPACRGYAVAVDLLGWPELQAVAVADTWGHPLDPEQTFDPSRQILFRVVESMEKTHVPYGGTTPVRVKSSAHRVFVLCPACAKWIPVGRFPQHAPMHGLVGVRSGGDANKLRLLPYGAADVQVLHDALLEDGRITLVPRLPRPNAGAYAGIMPANPCAICRRRLPSWIPVFQITVPPLGAHGGERVYWQWGTLASWGAVQSTLATSVPAEAGNLVFAHVQCLGVDYLG